MEHIKAITLYNISTVKYRRDLYLWKNFHITVPIDLPPVHKRERIKQFVGTAAV